MGIRGHIRQVVPVMLLLAATGVAPTALAAPAAGVQNGISYVSGGIGSDEQQTFHDVFKEYNLHLAFANKVTGAFLAGVEVTIRDGKGTPVLQTTSEGPCLFANLPAGNYRISARNGELELRKNAALSAGRARNLVFLWPAEPGHEDGVADDPGSPNQDDGPPGCW